jgi:hypothetical protein
MLGHEAGCSDCKSRHQPEATLQERLLDSTTEYGCIVHACLALRREAADTIMEQQREIERLQKRIDAIHEAAICVCDSAEDKIETIMGLSKVLDK